ncbi:hypothetical protein ACQCN2_16210 [Brevibacillus ginsengisoli]|uniref:hypothetical protein n=1 Tax=Brevibacillus ginsengisoli TaxID=363854 RepID=UPI003CF8382A
MDMPRIGINIFKKEVNEIVKKSVNYKLDKASIIDGYYTLERNNLFFEVDNYDNAIIFAKDDSTKDLLFGIIGQDTDYNWIFDDETIKEAVKRTLDEIKQEILPLEKNEEVRKQEEFCLRKEQEEKEKNDRLERIKKMLS